MTAASAQLLIDSARSGDLARVGTLLAAGADWRAQNEEALYQALKHDHTEIVKALLIAMLHTPVANKTEEESASDKATDLLEENFLKASLTRMNPLQMVSFSIRHQSSGLFRYLREEQLEVLLENGLVYSHAFRQHRFVNDLLDAGANVQYAAGEWLCQLVSRGEMKLVRELLSRGVNPNKLWRTSTGDAHCLQAAASLQDPAQRRDFLELLLDAGADLRAEGCAAITQMMYDGLTDVFALYDRLDPGSNVMAVLGHGQSLFIAPVMQEEALRRFPFLKPWIGRDMISPLASADQAVVEDWFGRLAPGDLAADDGFILKLAVASPRAESIVPRLLERGALPNTQKDPPLKIAALLGNAGLIEVLVQGGADIYAAHAAALRDGNKIYRKEVIAALEAQVENTAAAAARALAAEFPAVPDLAALRQPSPTTGDTGLLLAAKAGQLQPRAGMTAEDFLQENGHRATVATILATRGEYALLFSPKIWTGTMPGMEKVWEALTPDEQKQAVPLYQHLLQSRTVSMKQQRLKQQARPHKPRFGQPAAS